MQSFEVFKIAVVKRVFIIPFDLARDYARVEFLYVIDLRQ